MRTEQLWNEEAVNSSLPTMSFLIASVIGIGLAASGEIYLVKVLTASRSIPAGKKHRIKLGIPWYEWVTNVCSSENQVSNSQWCFHCRIFIFCSWPAAGTLWPPTRSQQTQHGIKQHNNSKFSLPPHRAELTSSAAHHSPRSKTFQASEIPNF